MSTNISPLDELILSDAAASMKGFSPGKVFHLADSEMLPYALRYPISMSGQSSRFPRSDLRPHAGGVTFRFEGDRAGDAQSHGGRARMHESPRTTPADSPI